MRYYFAPLEGVTGHLFRSAHNRYFGGVDEYFMPFFSPSQEHSFTRKSFADCLPEHNEGLFAVPQLLTKRAEDFIWAANELEQLGYTQVNLNLGCPSGTVTAKGKGAGFLAFLPQLDDFLEEVFSAVHISISVKTRLGVRAPGEFEALLALYNQYPISELIIHPRVRVDFYRDPVRLAAFDAALPASRSPVCYNGDLATAADCSACSARYPTLAAMMLGRGLVANPALLRQLRGGPGATRAQLQAFHDELYEGYARAFGSGRNAMCRMKELWSYLICLFSHNAFYAKSLKKATDTRTYEALVAGLFQDLPLLDAAVPTWALPWPPPQADPSSPAASSTRAGAY